MNTAVHNAIQKVPERKEYGFLEILFSSLILLLFLPKINLISIGTYNTGVRLDDFVMGFLWIFLIIRCCLMGWAKFSKIEIGLMVFTFCQLISRMMMGGSIFYVFRIMEYFIFFYLGLILKDKIAFGKIFMLWCLINLIITILQRYGVIGGFSSLGYVFEEQRAPGLTAGPWETGMVINLITAYFFWGDRKLAFKQNVIFYLINIVAITLGQSRAPLFVHLLLGVSYFRKKLFSPEFVYIVIFFLVANCGLRLVFNGGIKKIENQETVVSRMTDLLSQDNISNIEEIIARVEPQDEELETWKSNEQQINLDAGDLSLYFRCMNWVFAMKTWFAKLPGSLFFGVGPGLFNGSIDSSFIRVFSESGILGLLSLGLFYFYIFKNDFNYIKYLPAFFINMLVIDVYISYKSNAFLFLLVGLGKWGDKIMHPPRGNLNVDHL